MSKWTGIFLLAVWTLAQGAGAEALAQGREVAVASDGQWEWEDPDWSPFSGSLKISRTLEISAAPGPEGLAWKVWGQLQFEASWDKQRDAQGKSVYGDHAALARAEVFGELRPASFIRIYGHLLHQDVDSGVKLDEAFVVLGQGRDFPGYLMGGRVYPAVGLFESFMVSDPITKVVFETQAIAVEAGWAGDWLRAGVSGYNPAVRRPGQGGDFWQTYLLRVDISPPAEALGGLKLVLGGAYTNNIAASGFFEEQVPGQRLESLPGGWSLSANAKWGPLTLLAEYLRADSFAAGTLEFAPPGSSVQPWAFNLELSWAVAEGWRLSGRWEGGGDLYSEAPQRQGGLCLSWEPVAHVGLALEYLRGEFDDGSRQDLITSQLSLFF
ncbi:MAG: LbtU family siderophore porin [Proteobacteria bacterium]|nr:LbtU family siderophore porin [Pseudomonadota bacterium]MBU1450110.1 LbtU family siderophore porin [Pseudomonadota bacterium]MBU2469444.1 LbtU family siderophore porin [Pseudomonadota bacterium]MBU2517511.1 LbtU family siderophore porin [Pseudomonadota bacterium]